MLTLTLPDRTLAYQQCSASQENKDKPGIVFLSGFSSDMTGSKSTFLYDSCVKAGLSCLCFDYRGHGQSSGTFEEGCIGDWADDALKAVTTLTQGPQIIIGSSMGGWIGMLLARTCPERFAAFIGIAAAPDFTEDMILPTLTQGQKEELAREGKTYDIDAPEDFRIPFTQKLLDEGKEHLVLRGPITLDVPVRLLQGMMDDKVPLDTPMKIVKTLSTNNARITYVKDGDHGLSKPDDLALLWQTVTTILAFN